MARLCLSCVRSSSSLIMCISPVRIPNPNYGLTSEFVRATTDTVSRYMNVPCGVCSECLMKRQSDLVQRSRALALDHYIFFCTLTYNRQSLPHVTCSSGLDIPYADISDVQKMMKRIRVSNLFGRKFLYYFVSERGSQKGRPHFHGLLFFPKLPQDDKLFPAQFEPTVRQVLFSQWKRNYGSDRSPVWKPLFTYRTKFVAGKKYANFDCHYVVPHSTEHGSDDVAFYVTKYVLKPCDKERKLQQALRLNLSPEEYEDIWKIVRSRRVSSLRYGAATKLETDYIRHCIDKSSSDPSGLKYFAQDGSPAPLARYYRRFVSPEAGLRSVTARGGPLALKDRSQTELDESVYNGVRIQNEVSQRDISEFLTD